MTGFAAATAITPDGPGAYASVVDGQWSAPRGPNGGYLAAIVLRAMAAEVADGEKAPRSLTLHYLRPPQPGPLRTTVAIERAGRAVTSLSARMHQDGELCVLAVGAFGVELPTALDYADDRMPEGMPAPEAVEPLPWLEPMPPILGRMLVRPVLGGHLFTGQPQARTGGWLSFREAHPADAFAVAQFTDAWMPAPFTRLTQPSAAPTIDLTIHFRRRLPHGDPLAPVLIDVSSRTSAEGYFEEDTRIWAPDGALLAQSRQLALLRPMNRG